MGGTTYQLIRERQMGLIRDLVPTELAGDRFRSYEDPALDFGDSVNAGGESFRVFEIQHGLDYADEKYLDQLTESVVHTELLLVAYPRVGEFQGRRLEYVIDQDLTDLTRVIGQRGYASYDALGAGQHNAMRIATFVQDLDAVRVLGIRFQLEYDRSIP